MPPRQLVNCTHCSYFEVWMKPGMNFFFCKNGGCERHHCFHCKATVPNISHLDPEAEEDAGAYADGQEELEEHFVCAELAPQKTIVDAAMEAGCVMKCPGCGIKGMKDDVRAG